MPFLLSLSLVFLVISKRQGKRIHFHILYNIYVDWVVYKYLKRFCPSHVCICVFDQILSVKHIMEGIFIHCLNFLETTFSDGKTFLKLRKYVSLFTQSAPAECYQQFLRKSVSDFHIPFVLSFLCNT